MRNIMLHSSPTQKRYIVRKETERDSNDFISSFSNITLIDVPDYYLILTSSK